MKRNIKTVLFDLDGVVVFTDKYHFNAWSRLCRENNWQFDEILNHQLRGVPRMKSLELILEYNNIIISEIAKQEHAERKNTYYKESLKAISKEDLVPGVIQFIKQLRSRKIKIGLCSSSKNAGTIINLLNLTDLFDVIITGHDFKRAKPDPEIFQLAAAKLYIPCENCVVFEDAPSGVAAALAAGMDCIGVGDPEILTAAARTIKHYNEIDIDMLLS
jgi:beta-phosphoglucomutase